MMTVWKLQDAKSNFSKVVKDGLETGPQCLTRRGTNAVVVLSAETYETLVSDKPGFKQCLLDGPKIDGGLAIDRLKGHPRDIEL